MKETHDFEKYANMIYKLALREYNGRKKERPDVQFDDVYSEGLMIYTVCLKEYDGSKGMKFSTYLYQNLWGRMADFYECSLKPITHYEDFKLNDSGEKTIRYEDTLIATNYEIDDRTKELIESAREYLSYEGFKVFEYLISFEWVSKKAKVKPNVKAISQKFGYEPAIIDSIMSEIKVFWNKEGWKVA